MLPEILEGEEDKAPGWLGEERSLSGGNPDSIEWTKGEAALAAAPHVCSGGASAVGAAVAAAVAG